MGILKSFFGPSKEQIWSQISDDIGGEFITGEFWDEYALVYSHGEWQIILDTFTVVNSAGRGVPTTTTYTRMRAPFINKDGLYFKIYREGLFGKIGKFFGMQDITIGDKFFDNNFIIKGNDENKIKMLLLNDELKKLIDLQPKISFEIRDDNGWYSDQFPEGVDELYFQREGIIKEKILLKGLFDLFSLTLERLVRIDSAYEDDPAIIID